MKLLLLVCLLFGFASATELEIKFDEKVIKAFGDRVPLTARAILKNDEIHVELTNESKTFITVTKKSSGMTSHYLKPDGSKVGEGGWGAMSDSLQHDHVVLRPKADKRVNSGLYSTWIVGKFAGTHPTASSFVFSMHLAGYFPGVDDYVHFSVEGSVPIETVSEEAEVPEE
jgi:hypothetical protein